MVNGRKDTSPALDDVLKDYWTVYAGFPWHGGRGVGKSLQVNWYSYGQEKKKPIQQFLKDKATVLFGDAEDGPCEVCMGQEKTWKARVVDKKRLFAIATSRLGLVRVLI